MIRIARPKARTIALVALPLAAVAVTAPTVALALDSPSTNVFKGCLRPDGSLDSVKKNPTTAPDCGAKFGLPSIPAGEVITWNQQGVKGDTGAAGAASTVAGPAGRSAYQIAVDAGFDGTVTEWLASLKGTNGNAGRNGVTGYRMVATQTKAKARTAATYTVKCKDGRYALGGGLNGTSDLILNGSGPTPDAKGWVVRVTNVAAKSRTVHVYVTCAYATS
jgi:hypothetical protein